MLKYIIYRSMNAQFEINLTKNEEVMNKSQSPPKPPHSASLAYNVKKGNRCNFIPNMEDLVTVLIEKAKL